MPRPPARTADREHIYSATMTVGPNVVDPEAHLVEPGAAIVARRPGLVVGVEEQEAPVTGADELAAGRTARRCRRGSSRRPGRAPEWVSARTSRSHCSVSSDPNAGGHRARVRRPSSDRAPSPRRGCRRAAAEVRQPTVAAGLDREHVGRRPADAGVEEQQVVVELVPGRRREVERRDLDAVVGVERRTR